MDLVVAGSNPVDHPIWLSPHSRLATPEKLSRYDANATVALLSIAMKRDLFPWFREHGLDVDRAKASIALE